MKTMQKPKNQTDIFSETAVFDYVAGNQSDEARANFERILARDESLQEAVKAEQRLRSELLDIEHKKKRDEAVRADNIDDFFKRLNEQEGSELQNRSFENSSRPQLSISNWFGIAGVAASVAFVTILFVYQQPSQVTEEFSLLSDDASPKQADFGSLVKANRVAQVWLANELAKDDALELFTKHQLEPVGRAGVAWIVSAGSALTTQQLSGLAELEQIERISLISFDSKTKTTN